MFIDNLVVSILFIFMISLLVDLSIGELPNSIHPVVIIGKFIDYFTVSYINIKNRLSGVLLTFSVCLVIFLLCFILYYVFLGLLSWFNILFLILCGVFLSSLYSIKLLVDSTIDIKLKLNESLDIARDAMSYLVSRDTDELSEENIISASIETMTENITDSFVSSLFYFLLFCLIGMFFGFTQFNVIFIGLVACLFFRIINTLDAMVGYDNSKFHFIGWFPAHLDDILNFIPSRFSGLMVVLSSFILGLDYRNSFHIMLRDSSNTPSPNSGFTMAAVAGALNIQLEKKNVYILGDKDTVLSLVDIDLAVSLTRVTILFSSIVLILLFLLVVYLF